MKVETGAPSWRFAELELGSIESLLLTRSDARVEQKGGAGERARSPEETRPDGHRNEDVQDGIPHQIEQHEKSERLPTVLLQEAAPSDLAPVGTELSDAGSQGGETHQAGDPR
jgi:hypothetical protein